MPKLREETHLILDGEVRVYRRERSKRWHKNGDRKASTRYQHQIFITHRHTLTRVRARGIAFEGSISCKMGVIAICGQSRRRQRMRWTAGTSTG